MDRLPGDVEEREPYESERNYFINNPHVAGMAAEDDRVVMNPYSALNESERNSVRLNEAARVVMRKKLPPSFELTEQQKKIFKNYSKNDSDIKATVAARILSGDPSAGESTWQQMDFVEQLRSVMGINNRKGAK